MKHANFFVLSAMAVISASPSLTFAAAKVGKCEGLFEPSKSAVVAGATKAPKPAKTSKAAISEAKTSTELVVEEIPMFLKERVVIEGGLHSYVQSSFIPFRHSAGVDTRARTEDGEFIAVSFLTDVPASAPVSGQLGYSGANANQPLAHTSSGTALVNSNRALAAPKPTVTTVAEMRARGLNPTEILTVYARTQFGRNQLDEKSVAFVVRTMEGSPEFVSAAMAYHEGRTIRDEGQVVEARTNQLSAARAGGLAVNLANTGSYRYFRFTPEGVNQEVIARVLDINHQKAPEAGFHVLVEWMKPANDSDIRIRHVQTLTVKELQTMRPMPESIRNVIKSEFNETLSPLEIQTRKLAELSNLKTFGFTDMARKEGGSSRESDPLSRMSGQAHIVSRVQVEERFGKLDDLLTTDEKNAGHNWRIFDVMARLDPRYILKRFDARGTDFRYLFVITEDGQLKLSPFTEASANYRPELLRLAHGRRVFATGEFSIHQDGTLDVRLRSEEYQDINDQHGIHRAFQTAGQEGLNSFVAFTFGLQAGRMVRDLSSEFTRTFYTENGIMPEGVKDDLGGDRYGHTSYFNAFSGDRRETNGRFGGFNSQNTYDYARGVFGASGMGRTAESRVKSASVTWTNEKGPLTFEAWTKQAGVDAQLHMKSEWAHYVMRTNPQMSLEAIKKSYRKLAQQLHPDRRTDIPVTQATAIFQTMKSAYDHFEASLQ